jgi:catechol 2,3-dioxygenase-like lactoylglutathione lyase family enzyme/DNA-binding CsgD family transcriptional regulator
MTRTRGRPPHNDRLTPAEWRIVDAVRHGLSNRRIAELKGVSLDAVKFHVANAIAKLGLEGRRALRQWRGAPIGSPSRSDGMDSDETPTIVGLGQISRTVSNLDEAQSWYRDVLGLRHLYTFGTLAFFDCGGTRLMLSRSGDVQGGESLLYLRVADIDAAYGELSRRGVDFVGAPHMVHRHEDGTEEWMAFFKDPDGRHLAIMSSAVPSAPAPG